MLEVVIIISALIGLGIASAYDLKWKYVPDYVSYSLLIIAFGLRGLYALEVADIMLLVWSLIGSASLFGFGYVLYKTGAWGGGDVKIAAVAGAFLSWFPNDLTPFFINFAINLMIIGALYGVPMAMIIALKKKPKIKLKQYERVTIPGAIIGAAIIMIMLKSLYSVIISACLVLIASLRVFKVIEEKCFVKKANPKELIDGDWLLDPIKVGKQVIKPRKEGLTKKEVALINKWYKQGKLKKVWIKDGIAYVPAFLITAVMTLFFDNILLRLIMQGFGF